MAVAELDIASARGRHADWLQATQPRFLSEEESSAGEGCMTISQARHPLLLGPCLAPLPVAPTASDTEPSVGIGQSMPSGKSAEPSQSRSRAPPVPLDLLVPSGKTVVVVTGPNTGLSACFDPCLLMLTNSLLLSCCKTESGILSKQIFQQT